MKKRSVMALVASGLLAAMLPSVVTAQAGSSTNATTFAIPAPEYVWSGRLASELTRDYIWDRRLSSTSAPDYIWDRRLSSTSTPDYVWSGRLAGSPTHELTLAT